MNKIFKKAATAITLTVAMGATSPTLLAESNGLDILSDSVRILDKGERAKRTGNIGIIGSEIKRQGTISFNKDRSAWSKCSRSANSTYRGNKTDYVISIKADAKDAYNQRMSDAKALYDTGAVDRQEYQQTKRNNRIGYGVLTRELRENFVIESCGNKPEKADYSNIERGQNLQQIQRIKRDLERLNRRY